MSRQPGVDFRAWLMAAIFAAMVWGFHLMVFAHAPHAFNNSQEDMSFAWLVPPISLYMLWSERRTLLASLGAPSVVGLLLGVPFLALGFLGVRGIQLRLEIVAFVGLLVASTWALYGRRAAGAVLFPVLYLLFCIPLATFLDVVTVHLRIFVTGLASALLGAAPLKWLAGDIVRQGTMLGAADGSFAIDVADPCSGLRSLFALMALTAAYAYMSQRTWLRRAVLFALSVPVAVAGNVARLVTICLVAKCCSKDFATGYYHDYSGFIVYAVAVVLIALFDKLLKRVRPAADLPRREGDAPPPAAVVPARRGVVVPVVYAGMVAVAMAFQSATPEVTVAEAPSVALADIPGCESEPLEPSEAERTILPADTRIEKRIYTRADGEWFQVSVVVGGTSKSSIHRPELCLPSQGFQMVSPRTVEVGGVSWRFITLEARGERPIGFAYTFFNQDGFRTASHVRRIFRDVWDRSVHNRIDRWVMVTVNSSRAGDDALREIAEALKGVFR